jgi:hypothetical protein
VVERGPWGCLLHLPDVFAGVLPAYRPGEDPEARVLHGMRGHGGGVHYGRILRMRGGIQAGLPELLLLEHQSRFLVLRVTAAL